jgi:predicted TPR repeat methyltransferase
MKYAAYLQSADPKAALPAYQHVLDVQPDNAEALFIVARYHQNAGEVATAVEELIRAVRLKSADAEMIRLFVSEFVDDLRALGNSQFVPQVSAAAAEALKARAERKP